MSPPARRKGKSAGPLAGALIFLASLALCLTIVELACRLWGVDYNPNPNWMFHATLGWTQTRAVAYDYQVDGHEVRVEFNSLGFRDVEHSFEKAAGKRRIVVAGDSFSEAVQVNLEETYYKRLAQRLNESSSSEWEAINLGVGDFGNVQEWLALSQLGVRYSPDIVIFQIFPLNDICNNSIELAGLCKSANDDFRPYFVRSSDGWEVAFAQGGRQWLRSRLISFGVLELLWRRIRSEPALITHEIHESRYVQRGIAYDPLLYTFVPEENQIEGVREGWAVLEEVLDRVNALAREKNFRWIPVVIPFEIRVGDRWQAFAANFPGLPMVQDYPERRLEKKFQQLGVPFVLAKEVFEKQPEGIYPGRDGHLNPAAHGRLAEALREAIQTAGWTH